MVKLHRIPYHQGFLILADYWLVEFPMHFQMTIPIYGKRSHVFRSM